MNKHEKYFEDDLEAIFEKADIQALRSDIEVLGRDFMAVGDNLSMSMINMSNMLGIPVNKDIVRRARRGREKEEALKKNRSSSLLKGLGSISLFP
jgi:hypothetical protein